MQSNNPQSRKTLIIVQAGLIAALYTVLTIICNAMGLASGVIQVRFSEALCILPCFTVAGVPGLFVGCLVSNLVTGGAVWDIVFGSLATLLGAVGTRLLRKMSTETRSVKALSGDTTTHSIRSDSALILLPTA